MSSVHRTCGDLAEPHCISIEGSYGFGRFMWRRGGASLHVFVRSLFLFIPVAVAKPQKLG
jgi:hypothetical protein